MPDKIYKVSTPAADSSTAKADLFSLLGNPDIFKALVKADESYLHWDDLQYKTWLPKEQLPTKETFWSLVSIRRSFGSITPIKDKTNTPFKMNTQHYSEFLHIIDKEMAGNFMGISNFSENDKTQFIARNLIEESIASSQLEGANTSRTAAKKMLLEGRQPRDKSEQMIVNNHKAMLRIEQSLYKENLSWDLICELHSIITEQTIAKDKQGTIRETFDEHGERLKIIPWEDGTVTYITPDKEFVEAQLPHLIDFANDKKTEASGFIHPVIKAIMIHFWIGLLHPFEDGNGRLARILFYWYLLKHEYWAFKYLSLSEKIKKSSRQYSMAYIYSEQVNCDLTYFIHYNIEKIKIARKDFKDYIKNKIQENRSNNIIKKNKYHFNERQIKLLHYFNQQMESQTTLKAHQQLHAIKKGSAIADLKELVEKGFLNKLRDGRRTFYLPTNKVSKLFKT